MRINLITNLKNTAGLGKEVKLYTDFFESLGHTVHPIQWDEPFNIQSADINLFDELINMALLNCAPRNWIMPHAEWWRTEWTQYLPFFQRVICKTQHALDVFRKLVYYPSHVYYTENISRDFYDPKIKKERSFLHVEGQSITKGTDAVILAWAFWNVQVPLTIVSHRHTAKTFQGANLDYIQFRENITDDELAYELNRNQYFIMPSDYEGWSHSLHEAMACKATIISTDAPPMVDWCPTPLRVWSEESREQGAVKLRKVKAEAVAVAVQTALALAPEYIQRFAEKSRQKFLEDCDFFKKRMAELIG